MGPVPARRRRGAPAGRPGGGGTGRPGRSRRAAERDEDLESARRARWPWPSTALLTAFVETGSGFADHAQADERAALDPWGRVLLFGAGARCRRRGWRTVAVLGGTVAAVLVYLGAGYPYGPVFLTVAVACFTAVVSGRRYAAWAATGTLWAGHLLLVHLLYRWLPPAGDDAASWD
ncbi:histidine kinase OS=Streptomyces albaduncus OX=68172 GN=FHS32_002045 PE=4 SV=1 [Streptomyces griseoloalbus]